MPDAVQEIHAADLLKGNKIHNSTPPTPRKPRLNAIQGQQQQALKAQAHLLTTSTQLIETQNTHIQTLTGLRQTLEEYVEDRRELEKNQKEQIAILTTQNESAERLIEAGEEEIVKLREVVRVQGEVEKGLRSEKRDVQRLRGGEREIVKALKEHVLGLKQQIKILEELVRKYRGSGERSLKDRLEDKGQALPPKPT